MVPFFVLRNGSLVSPTVFNVYLFCQLLAENQFSPDIALIDDELFSAPDCYAATC